MTKHEARNPAIYTRYSSELQSPTSTDDQVSLLARLAKSHGFGEPSVFSDTAISGTHIQRPALQRLLVEARAGRIHTILVEDLSRLSRDLGESDRILKELRYLDVRVIGADGFDTANAFSQMQAGLQGLMNEAYIEDLRRRTKRGQQGAFERKRSTGGRAYGYRSEPTQDGGYRRIVDPREAKIVQRIFREAAAGRSAYSIAHALNKDRIPGPRGTPWARSAIYPDPKRSGVGILGNELYTGKLIWNRSHWVKPPGSSKRKRIENPPSDWLIEHDESLRIISDELWDQARSRIQDSRLGSRQPSHRGSSILSGLLRCGTCGGNYVLLNAERFGCLCRKERGPTACEQSITAKRTVTEERIIEHIRLGLLKPKAVAIFVEEYRLAQAEDAKLSRNEDPVEIAQREVAAAEKRIRNIMGAIEAGIYTPTTAEALRSAEADKEAALRRLKSSEQASRSGSGSGIDIDPRMLFRSMLADLNAHLNASPEEVRASLRDMLGAIVIEDRHGEPFARIPTGAAFQAILLRSLGQVDFGGSGGRICPQSTPETLVSLAA